MPDNAPFVRDAMQDFVAEFLSGSEAFKRRYPGMPAGLAWHCEPIRAEFMEAFNVWLEDRLALMPTTVDALKTKEPGEPPKPEDFGNRQMALFQDLLCNTALERDSLSNVFDLWDSIPRYSISRQAMDKVRNEHGMLPLMKIDFHYKGMPFKAIIRPARIEEKDGTTKDYYPSANEELAEDALRKIAADQQKQNGFFDKLNHRSGVVFSLYMLRKELIRRGHTRSYHEIVLSLDILSLSIIDIRTSDDNEIKGISRSNYFPSLAAVSKHQLGEDPQAKWIVQFHPLVTQALNELTYRQFNYAQMMSHRTQLARWLHKQLSLKFTFASLMTSFEMRYSTIKRDSALLNSYGRERKAIEAMDTALDELVKAKVLSKFNKNPVIGFRGKVDDVIYTLFASINFSHEMKAANKRKQLAEDRQTEAIKSSTAPKQR